MTYKKPEVIVLGHAVRVIEQRPLQGKAIPSSFEVLTRRTINPAYDLDE